MPLSTTSRSSVCATLTISGDSIGCGRATARSKCVSYGVPFAKSSRVIVSVGAFRPPFAIRPISFASASGWSPDAPIAAAYDGVTSANG